MLLLLLVVLQIRVFIVIAEHESMHVFFARKRPHDDADNGKGKTDRCRNHPNSLSDDGYIQRWQSTAADAVAAELAACPV